MEIEAKYRITGEVGPQEVEALVLSPYTLGPRRQHDLHDTLFDTPARSLLGRRYALRVRLDHATGEGVVTLKGPATLARDTHRREEWELPLVAAAAHDPAAWPDEMQRRVRALVGEAPLAPLGQLINQRQSWALYHDGAEVAEIALDRGEIQMGRRCEPFHELEVELKGRGTQADIDAIVARLVAALPLESEPRSKSQRALALLERESGHAG